MKQLALAAPPMNRANRLLLATTLLGLGVGLFAASPPADAFCGFYVAGADQDLYNNATLVVLMREGTRTVLSMQNDYQGPPEDFALVIPVPVVLKEGDVKTLPREVFDRVDKLAAPRLVEYWEEDPCAPPPDPMIDGVRNSRGVEEDGPPGELGVKIEAKFEVGEYQVVVLSAEDSTGLETWLKQEKYSIPAGAAPLLEPYVQAGMKFFVAKVDVEKVKFENGRAFLSPLRFHYDSPEFSLPVRLGLINAQGPQDLLVHILAKNQRFEVANYPNATIPTNLDVKELTKAQFGKFYVSLFDHTLAQHPKAVVTEYSWSAGSCDPCPEPPLTLAELALLGVDVLPSYADTIGKSVREQTAFDSELEYSVPAEFVLTRLHARYDKDSLGEDLVFAEAPPITGGREFRSDGKLEQGTIEQLPTYPNNFQARYIIRHPWTGKVDCDQPRHGNWGGPPEGANQPTVARQLAFEERDAVLATFVTVESAKIVDVVLADGPAVPDPPPAETKPNKPTAVEPKAKTEEKAGDPGCRCASTTDPAGLGLGLLSLLALLRVRRRNLS